MPGANALIPSSAYMYQSIRSGASRASAKRSRRKTLMYCTAIL